MPRCLITMCTESGARSRSHGLAAEILQAQAVSLDISLLLQNTSWDQYRDNFVKTLHEAVNCYDANATVFGDIDILSHQQWEQEVCREVGIEALLPLWQMQREELVDDFLGAGFEAVIVAVDGNKLDGSYVGKPFSKAIIKDFATQGIDVCGENGEFHTVVIDGPLFRQRIELEANGAPVKYDGYWFQDFGLRHEICK